MLLSKANLRVYESAAKEKGRYALNGVLIEPDGSTVAADGAQLIAVEGAPVLGADECPIDHVPVKPDGVIVPAETFKELLKGIPKQKRNARGGEFTQLAAVTHCDGQIELATYDRENIRRLKTVPVDGQFPGYQAVLPYRDGSEPIARIAFGSKRMIDFLSTINKACAAARDAWVDLEIYGERKPMIVRAQTEDGQHILGVLSPVVHDEDSDVQIGERSRWEQRWNPEIRWLAGRADHAARRGQARAQLVQRLCRKAMGALLHKSSGANPGITGLWKLADHLHDGPGDPISDAANALLELGAECRRSDPEYRNKFDLD